MALTIFPVYDIIDYVDDISQQRIKAMKLTTKGRYGTRALLDLALHQAEEPVLLKDIAKRQEISTWYLEHLIAPLIAGGIVRSSRGAKGGISLAQPPEQIRLSTIIQLLEGSVAPVACVNDPGVCSRSELCVTRDVWTKIKRAINGVLESTTLQDLVEEQKRKERREQVMYNI